MVPLSVRKSLWAWYYGLRAFEHCETCCDYILKQNLTDEHPLYYSLNAAAHITYAKPFTRSRGIERLDEVIIPSRYKKAHQQIIDFRNQLYAHTDTEGNPNPAGDRSVDVIYAFEGRKKGFKLLEVTVKPPGIKNLQVLCDVLIAKAQYHMNKILNQYGKSFPQTPGNYRIGFNSSDPSFTKI